jgi:hypothetical protein
MHLRRPMISFFVDRVGKRETGDSTFSPDAIGAHLPLAMARAASI